MGANIFAEGPEETPPLRIQGGSLRGIRYRPPVAKCAGERRVAVGRSLCKGQDHCDRASTDSESYGDDV